jgi:hypothetical protein
MAKSNYLRAIWIATPAGGGVSFSSPFVEYDEHYVKGPNGRTKHYISEVPRGITVTVARGDETIVEKGREKFELYEGEFVVQKNDINVTALKEMVQSGMIEMVDQDLHYEYLEQDVPEMIEETITTGRMVEVNDIPRSKKEAQKDLNQKRTEILKDHQASEKNVNDAIKAELSALKCIKINKDKVIEGIIDKGVESIEQLSNTDKDILLSVKGIGAKVAESILKEAKELTEPQEG